MAKGDVIGYAQIIDGGEPEIPDISAELDALFPEYAELERLRAENARLREELQIAICNWDNMFDGRIELLKVMEAAQYVIDANLDGDTVMVSRQAFNLLDTALSEAREDSDDIS